MTALLARVTARWRSLIAAAATRSSRRGSAGDRPRVPNVGWVVAIAALVAAIVVFATVHRRAAQARLSAAQISRVMWRTVLVREPLEHFYPAGQLMTTSDGSTGVFTAEVGTVLPSTDGDGQLVFFWHNSRFVGWDSAVDNMDVLEVQSLGQESFRVTYANYAPDDPACCPSLIPISVVYQWTGARFRAQGPLPMIRPIPSLVHLIH